MVALKEIKSIKELSKNELLTGGTFACSGCNAILGEKLTIKALGKNIIMVNTSGCMTLTAEYPYTPYKIPWVHNAIENAASTATGISMGLKSLKKDKDIHIVCYAGDGAVYDIGFQALSGAANRNENIIFVCYNNSSYANTGFQRTSATPLGARTSTTPIGKNNLVGSLLPRKNMAKIMAMHQIPYAATATTAYPLDYINKLRKASRIKGFKFIDLLTPCMPGWLIDSSQGIKTSKLLVQSGIWPVYEIENQNFKLNIEPEMIKVDEVFKAQGRFTHLKKETIKQIQKMIDEEWKLIKQGKYWLSKEY